MARRSDHTREELKTMAVEAGQKIMSDGGLDAFSTRKLAKEIGYTVGTLYNVFKDSNDIILHINAVTLDALHAYIIEGSPNKCQAAKKSSTLSAKDTIKKLASLYICFANKNYNCWNALFTFSLPQGVELPDWYIGKMQNLFLLIEKALSPLLQDDGKTTERTAKVLWASVHGICHLSFTGKLDAVGAEEVQVLADDMIEKYMRGLAI